MLQATGPVEEILLGNLGARINLRGYDGVDREPRGNATTAVGAALSSGNYGLIEQTTHGKNIAVPLIATAATAALTPANSVLLVDEAGAFIGSGKELRLYDATGAASYANLYRSAANVLKTDDSLLVAVDLTVLGNASITGTLAAGATTLGGNLLFTPDATYDIGASGATRPRDLFLSRNAVIGGTLQVVGVTTHNAGVIFSADNSFDIGASGATRPRDLFLGRNALVGGTLGVTGIATASAGVVFGVGTFAPSKLYRDAQYGLVIGGITGSTDDLLVVNNTGSTIFETPAGTVNMVHGGHILWATNNTNDVGATATRTRTIYVGTSIVSPTIGPTAAQQHTLPAVASDTIALIGAGQTYVSPVLTTPTINGGALAGTFSGSVTFSGTIALSSAGLALSITNNATIGGTLGVTGVATLSGGGALTGTFSGNPVLSGNPDFSGAPTFSGLTWTTFTPSVTQGAALTMTVNYARYRVIGKTAFVQIKMTYSSGVSAAPNDIQITGIPAAIQPARTGNLSVAGTFVFWDNSTSTQYVGYAASATTTIVIGFRDNVAGTAIGTNPNVAMAASDVVMATLMYEIA